MSSSTPSSRRPETFEEFYGQHVRYVQRCVRNAYWGPDPADDFDDIVQDVFVQAWCYYGKLRFEYVRAWLRTIVRTQVYARMRYDRERWRTRSLDAPLSDQHGTDDVIYNLLDKLGVGVDYDGALAAADVFESLRPEDMRLLIAWTEGFRAADLAVLLNTSPAAAEQRLIRARHRAMGSITVL